MTAPIPDAVIVDAVAAVEGLTEAPARPTPLPPRMPRTREQWLIEAAAKLDKLIKAAGFEPAPVRPSVGWPSSGGLSQRKRTIGQCWAADTAADGLSQIFVSPLLIDTVEVLGTLLHEQLHAAVGTECGHKGAFGKAARAVGLEGKMTATVPGADLAKRLEAIAAELGPYPHAALTPGVKHKPQATRMLKVVCGACGYQVRTTRKWLDLGVPTCPCGTVMDAPEGDDDEADA